MRTDQDDCGRRHGGYEPTFAGYDEQRLRTLMAALDPTDPTDQRTMLAAERKLAMLAEG